MRTLLVPDDGHWFPPFPREPTFHAPKDDRSPPRRARAVNDLISDYLGTHAQHSAFLDLGGIPSEGAPLFWGDFDHVQCAPRNAQYSLQIRTPLDFLGRTAPKVTERTRIGPATFCVTGVRPSFPCRHLKKRVPDL